MARGPAENVIQPLVVAVMVGCVAFAVVSLVHANVVSWDGTYLGLFCMLAALEAFVSYRLYRRRSLHIYGGTRFRLAECAILLALLQVAVDITGGHSLLSEGVPRFEPVTLLLFVPVLLSWEAATGTARDLSQVWEPALRLPNTGSPSDRLIRRFFLGGFVLFAAVGLTQAQNARPLGLSQASGSSAAVNILLYFLLGMIMLGQVHYGSLRGRWQLERAVLPPSLTGRWVRYSALFLGAVAIVTFLLPTGYAGVLLDAARTQSAALLAALGERLANLLSMLGVSSHPNVPPPPALRRRLPVHLPPQHPAVSRPQQGGHVDFRLIRAILFWLVTAGLGAYLLRGYLEQQRLELHLPRQLRLVTSLLARIGGALHRILRRTRRFAEQLADTVRRPQKQAVEPKRSTSDLRFLRGRSPRDRIVYYFLSAVERAERQGIRRRRSETAREVGAHISSMVPEAQGDLTALTEAYLEAQYSDHAVGREQAAAVRGRWERVQTALRQLRSGG